MTETDSAPADVLLAQDGAADVELTLRALRQGAPGVRVAVARDGAEALDFLLARGQHAARATLPPVTVALVDIRLARIDGLTLIDRLRAHPRTARLPIVVLTASLDPHDRSEAYRVGANSFVEMPVAFDAFVQVIGDVARYWMRINRT
jgi:two-component system response regulator